jgi:hypothetical protein
MACNLAAIPPNLDRRGHGTGLSLTRAVAETKIPPLVWNFQIWREDIGV